MKSDRVKGALEKVGPAGEVKTKVKSCLFRKEKLKVKKFYLSAKLKKMVRLMKKKSLLKDGTNSSDADKIED